MKSPKLTWLTRFATATFISAAASSAMLLASCAVSPNGPAGPGGSNGSLGSPNMSDYFYRTSAGWTYVYQNVENIYNSDGSISSTMTGSNDTVRTMGFDQIASNGDSLFRYQITYRVATNYAGRPYIPINYISATKSNKTHGAFVDVGYAVPGMQTMEAETQPVSTDTILAGIGGLIRTRSNDFTNSSSYVWQTDTIWYSEHNDSAFIWEHAGGMPGMPIVMERCVFIQNFQNGATWTYDVINNPNPTTTCIVAKPNLIQTVLGGTFNKTVKIRIATSEVDDKDFNREFKFYGCYTGPISQYDWWYVTSDGINFTMEDFNRQLISLTQN
ncbi:MAG TPA: hypothetical protein VFH95_00530 [Candidatus Kapabacteria bacterium]|nr:hypothetical protein [Candidatus Kapabacteria bacterium]